MLLCSKKHNAPGIESSCFSAHPSFVVKPKDQRVGMNGIAKFDCGANGNPPPSVFWTKEGSQELMFAGTTHGQMFVSEDGTLTIQVTRSCFCSDLGKHFSILCYVSANKRFAFVRVFYLELEQTYRQKTFCIGSRDIKEAKEKKKRLVFPVFSFCYCFIS